MAALVVGGIIVIWLALSGGRALLNSAGIELHRPALLAAAIVLAAFETLLFGLTVPAAPLLEESQRGLATGLLIALAWVINGAVPIRLWLRAGAPWPIKR